jgi:hypothetical protein
MQAAFQQLMQSPGQVQRLLQLLSSGPTNVPTPISTPITGAAQSGSWTPPASLDLPQLAQLALYENSIGGGNNNVLTFNHENIVGPSSTQLADDEARLARSYHDAGEIDADVDVLQANINALIENMGLDSALGTTSADSTHPQPPLPSSGEMPPAQPAADFDFEAFLTAFANAQDGEGEAANVNADAVVNDNISTSRPVPGSVSASGTGTGATNVFSEEPVIVGRKRTSDVAELALPLPEPSTAMPSRIAAAARTGATADGPPRAKRNKK